MLPIQPNEVSITTVTFQDGLDHGEVVVALDMAIIQAGIPAIFCQTWKDYLFSTVSNPNSGRDHYIARPISGSGPWFVYDDLNYGWEMNALFDANGDVVPVLAPNFGQSQAQPVNAQHGVGMMVPPPSGTTPMKTQSVELKVSSGKDPFAAMLDGLGLPSDP